MAAATLFFDGDRRRIYEVPPSSSYVVDDDGYRIYTPDDVVAAPKVLNIDVQRDLWSRAIDHWGSGHDWVAFPISRDGSEFTLDVTAGWKIVLANYPHQSVWNGNLLSNNGYELFDTSRLTAQGVFATIERAASLITYKSGSGLTQAQAIQLLELYQIMGLDVAAPLTVSQSARTAGEISQTIDGDQTETTIQRT